MKRANVFHIGPQKSGTTWLYRALKEHPQIVTSPKDSIHYMNMFFHRGQAWFDGHFGTDDLEESELKIFEPTPSYLRDSKAPERIFNYNPDTKIIFTARNPLERAFSHYWHEKKKDRFNFKFEEIFENYDLFTNWIEPGFYAHHYKRYLEFFSEKNIKILFFDDLNDDPKNFYQQTCEFIGVDSSFSPSILDKKVNVARPYKSRFQKKLEEKNRLLNLAVRVKGKISKKAYKETLEDIPTTIKNEIIDVYIEDIKELEKITGRNLSGWMNKY
ncbi:hypothetical protein BZG00_10505 [Salinivibrio kushneri]|uniref:Sulfotransferase domain-containing protein n=1 Tax=Salinivibrio kushneri TaxID=1908198 RepID=A0AB36JXC4_9GAMM|nr:sulfotransferase [Salinivibrio kushneri]OOE39312.1 hypothetical protein BZG00_10505 [Salinivibrio kushneri]QCP02456.1 sulfotransferase domain-containing protein [Salinivibrio kushneri]